MKTVLLILTLMVSTLTTLAVAEDRQAIQQQLDQACEAVRLEKLRPIREKYAAECVAEWDRSQEYCDRFYSDYGNTGGEAPVLFYELPECEKAWNYRQSYRRAD
ncbi:hypothetical protein [Methylophaga sp.]|uniref:hypothetical protein n=1 Tax=Methylophaga sp. TaxID=2024840 RepID=UPI002723A0DF|nr:hypothetical protein [Methylophaga sp.]MDO8827283.1 hypothetical protein [Methylophaga sp.]